MIEVSQNENLIEILTNGFKHYINIIWDKTIIFMSVILGIFLSAIGYPKSILAFIVTLVIADTIIKLFAITKQHYKKLTFNNFIIACFTNKISSKNMKNGLGVKAFFYLIFLYIAHQVSIIPEIIGGEYVSNVIYSLLFVIEGKSILENLIDYGFKQLKPLLKYFKTKENEILKDK